jgi:transforming growth factor-beta-induced protein
MKSLMLSAVVLCLTLAGCDHAEQKLPYPDSPSDEQLGQPTGGQGGHERLIDPNEPTITFVRPDAGVPDPGVTMTIAELARANPDLELFMRAVDMAGLAPVLNDASASMTVFAPDNAAFAAMLTELGRSRGLDGMSALQLQTILRYHVLPTRVAANQILAAANHSRLEAIGGSIKVRVAHAALQLDGHASITKADVQATNGILHVLDRVLLPSISDVLTTTGTLASFTSSIELADSAMPGPDLGKRLDDDSQSFTVFAPTNNGFENFLRQLVTSGISSLESFRPDQLAPIAKYHVAEGKVGSVDLGAFGGLQTLGGKVSTTRVGAVTSIDDATVLMADILCSNGVLHVIDAVLLPSITDVINADSRFRALNAAMIAADQDPTLTREVSDALDSPNRFTFFAPSDQAFNAFGVQPSAHQLFFHAVPGEPMYAARLITFTTPRSVTTSIDQPLVLQSSGSPPRITLLDRSGEEASVIQVDLFTSNGVIHVIDRVLVPPP